MPKSDFESWFSMSKILRIFLKKNLLKNINLGAHFVVLPILCIIERLLFLKFLNNLALFDSYFWPFNKSQEKTNVIFAISAIMPSIWNVFIKFRWHDEKLTTAITSLCFCKLNSIAWPQWWSFQNKGQLGVDFDWKINFKFF